MKVVRAGLLAVIAAASAETALAQLPPPPEVVLPPQVVRPDGITKTPRPRADLTPPDYPVQARRLGLAGETRLTLCVDADGRPHDAVVAKSSGSDLLDQAALDWVAEGGAWFEPAERDGVPVAMCDYSFTYVWSLQAAPDSASPIFSFPAPKTYPRADSLPEADRPVMLTRPPAPPYPASAIAARKEGRVTLSLCLKADGSIGAVRPLQTAGSDDLVMMTLFWVSQAKFSPAKKDGKPIAVCAVEVDYDWKLPE